MTFWLMVEQDFWYFYVSTCAEAYISLFNDVISQYSNDRKALI